MSETNENRAAAVGCNRLLGDIHARLLEQAEQWRTNTNDPHNINTAVYVALLEAANVFSCVLNDQPRPDSGEIQCDPNGDPRCPDCGGQVRKCGIDLYKCRKCGEGWTMERAA